MRHTSAARQMARYYQGRYDERHQAAQRLGKWTRWNEALALGIAKAEQMARHRATGRPVVDEHDVRLGMNLAEDEIRASEPNELDRAFLGV